MTSLSSHWCYLPLWERNGHCESRCLGLWLLEMLTKECLSPIKLKRQYTHLVPAITQTFQRLPRMSTKFSSDPLSSRKQEVITSVVKWPSEIWATIVQSRSVPQQLKEQPENKCWSSVSIWKFQRTKKSS